MSRSAGTLRNYSVLVTVSHRDKVVQAAPVRASIDIPLKNVLRCKTGIHSGALEEQNGLGQEDVLSPKVAYDNFEFQISHRADGAAGSGHQQSNGCYLGRGATAADDSAGGSRQLDQLSLAADVARISRHMHVASLHCCE